MSSFKPWAQEEQQERERDIKTQKNADDDEDKDEEAWKHEKIFLNETNYEYNNLFSIFSERGKGEKKNDENSAASLKNHVNENIFILFMLEYQIKFSAAFSLPFRGFKRWNYYKLNTKQTLIKQEELITKTPTAKHAPRDFA